jgi:hypothetical protein
MACFSCDTVEEVKHLKESQYLSIAVQKQSLYTTIVQQASKISKNLAAYMAGLVAVSPLQAWPV